MAYYWHTSSSMSRCQTPMRADACRMLGIAKWTDARGDLSFLQTGDPVPFAMRGIGWVYDVPPGWAGNGYACRQGHELLIAVSGSFDVVIDPEGAPRIESLDRPDIGLLVPEMVWHRLENFSPNTVAMIIGSSDHREADHIGTYSEFLRQRAAEHR